MRTARADLERIRSEAEVGNAAGQGQVEFAQEVLDTRRAQAETAMLRQEALRLLIDLTRGTEQIWRTRFELASKPGPARLRELHSRLTGFNQRIALWKQFLANSRDAAAGMTAAAEKRLAEGGVNALQRGVAETLVGTYEERQELYARLRTELTAIELLLKRIEQEEPARNGLPAPIKGSGSGN